MFNDVVVFTIYDISSKMNMFLNKINWVKSVTKYKTCIK